MFLNIKRQPMRIVIAQGRYVRVFFDDGNRGIEAVTAFNDRHAERMVEFTVHEFFIAGSAKTIAGTDSALVAVAAGNFFFNASGHIDTFHCSVSSG